MSDSPKSRAYGALPPEGMEWMVGKNVMEIDAIDAESKATGKTTAEIAAGDAWKKRLPPSNQG